MAWKTAVFELVSVVPLLMHNGQMADPSSPHARALKAAVQELKDKQKSKEGNSEELARIRDDVEWEGGLYFSKDAGPYIPAENIEAALAKAKPSLKKKVVTGVFAERIVLQYKGPRDIEGLKAKPEFRDRRCVALRGARLVRIRPKFEKWSGTLTLSYNDEVIKLDELVECVKEAGKKGCCDYKPRYGRWDVVAHSEAA